MQHNRVRPMVEGGILASIAVLFALISAYMPLVGPFVNLVWPVPIILLGVRHGYKWSIMATFVAGIIIAMLMHPLSAVGVVVGFGLIGIVLGHAFRSNFEPVKTLLWGSAASLISKVAVLAISAVVLGINPLNMETEALSKAFEQAVEMYRKLGMKEEDIAVISTNMQSMVQFMKLILPAGFVLAAIVDTFLNFQIAKIVLKKLGNQVKSFPKFKDWTFPGYIAYIFILALVAMYWGNSRQMTTLYHIAVNFQVITSTLLFIQGLALFYYLTDKYNLSRLVRGIILFLIFTNGLFTQMLIIAGAFDMAFDYRQLRRPR
ncbi:YybS family protein [Dendrosporobacter sp. 1207_IL3150]|uniref:YybS family protein n=1 Tax=Dendrosporobacter sp. 1207_IL3150 TaxID=3084054 RepID=UPI002FD96737